MTLEFSDSESIDTLKELRLSTVSTVSKGVVPSQWRTRSIS